MTSLSFFSLSHTQAKYKNQRKSMKAMEKDYRNKLALMQQALNNADSHKHKLRECDVWR